MLKKILIIDGVKSLNKSAQSEIKGGCVTNCYGMCNAIHSQCSSNCASSDIGCKNSCNNERTSCKLGCDRDFSHN
jgi:hypothetical protein